MGKILGCEVRSRCRVLIQTSPIVRPIDGSVRVNTIPRKCEFDSKRRATYVDSMWCLTPEQGVLQVVVGGGSGGGCVESFVKFVVSRSVFEKSRQPRRRPTTIHVTLVQKAHLFPFTCVSKFQVNFISLQFGFGLNLSEGRRHRKITKSRSHRPPIKR